MCALFTLKATYGELIASLSSTGVKLADYQQSPSLDHYQSSFDHRFLPHQQAPVCRLRNNELTLEPMNFSLIPQWSKERRPKFATHNARLETLTEKPTWKRPLLKNHALVPLSEFIEPIYEGAHAGHMVGFSGTNDQVLWAAGLFDEWLDPSTGELIPSFTIITHEPSDYVRQIGHDREPLFISPESFIAWLDTKERTPSFWIEFLKNAHLEPNLKVREDRKLKSKK